MWTWHSCLDHRGHDSSRYAGELAARAAENMVLLWFFVFVFPVSGSSVSVGIHCEGGVIAWVTGTLAMPGTQGRGPLLS